MFVCPYNSKNIVDEFWWNFFGGCVCVWLDFGADTDHDENTGIFNAIFTTPG